MTASMMVLILLGVPAQEDYFPLSEGATWTYRTHLEKDHVQKVVGTEKVAGVSCFVKRHGETEKFWLAAAKEGVTLHRAKGMTFEKPLLLVRFPLTKGDAWRGEGRSDAGRVIYAFTNVGEDEIVVPAGQYKAFRIDWTIGEGASGSAGSTWLARGVGMVKQSYRAGGVDAMMHLAKFEQPGGTLLPMAKGHVWIYKTEIEDIDRVTEAVGLEKVGEAECVVVEHKTQNRVLRKEWLQVGEEGVKFHKIQRGRTEMAVEKPFFKIKNDLRRDDIWEGEAMASVNPAKYYYRAEGEEEVEVPAGKYKAWKIKVRIEQGERHVASGFEWYAKGVGLVKSELTLTSGNESYTTTADLKEFRRGE